MTSPSPKAMVNTNNNASPAPPPRKKRASGRRPNKAELQRKYDEACAEACARGRTEGIAFALSKMATLVRRLELSGDSRAFQVSQHLYDALKQARLEEGAHQFFMDLTMDD